MAHLYRPDNSDILPVVIVVHGGYYKDIHSLDSYATIEIVNYLKSQNVAVWNIEYRTMEASGINNNAVWPAVFNDIAAAIDFLPIIAKQARLDLNKVMIIGHSAGAHLATWAACRQQIPKTSTLYQDEYQSVHRVMAISGILNLSHVDDLEQPEQILRLMGGTSGELPERYQACDPNLLHQDEIPMLIIHGDKDNAVAVSQAQQYYQQSKRNVQLQILEQADHFDMLPLENKQPKYWPMLKELISEQIDGLRAG